MSQLGNTMGLGHGYVDFAGSTVVHAVGGFCAMALSVILGPRLGKFGPDGKPRAFPAHNIVFVIIGTFILLFGWMGFNPGSTLGATDLRISVIAINTNLAAIACSATAMLFLRCDFRCMASVACWAPFLLVYLPMARTAQAGTALEAAAIWDRQGRALLGCSMATQSNFWCR